MSDRSLTPRDFGLLRDILELSKPDHPEPVQERVFQLLEHLAALIGCDGISLQELDSVRRCRTYCQAYEDGERWLGPPDDVGGQDQPGVDVFWDGWWTSPCSLPDRTGTSVTASLRSVYGEREWLRSPLNTEYLHVVDELLVGYPTSAGQSARFLIPRDHGAEFGHRELTLMEGLMPHLRSLVLESVRPGRLSRPRITRRQQEILRAVARGQTNREIGRSLGISEATVRKHLEGAYQRLGVLSRTGAVTVMSSMNSTA